MEYFRIASLVPIAGSLFYVLENGPELLRHFPALIVDTVRVCLLTILNNAQLVWHDPDLFLLLVLTVRYYRLVGHILAYFCLYKPDAIPENPSVTAQNTYVIIPTIDPGNVAFEKCIRSILTHSPKWLTIVTGGAEHRPKADEIAAKLRPHTTTTIQVCNTILPNKRHQMAMALDNIAKESEVHQDTIVVFVDDHAWWEGETYLAHLLAPFENQNVGLVGTKKRVARDHGKSLLDSFINFLGCVYLERHNFEITATNAIDGGVFIISARTCAIRASIAMQEDFSNGFLNEHFFFGIFGPLNSDDDNYITRYVVRNGWSTKFQNDGDSQNVMCTTLGIDGVSKIHGQWLRWARSQWRSNCASLFTDRSVWRRQWWTTHAALLTWFVNFAIIWDGLIFWSWYHSNGEDYHWYHIACIIFISKTIKLTWHFVRCPGDIIFLPGYFIFAYCHAYYKLVALLTFYDTTWSGRRLRTENPIDSDSDVDDDYEDSGDDSNESYLTGINAPESTRNASMPKLSIGGTNRSLRFKMPTASSEASSPSEHETLSSSSSNSFTAEYGKNPQYTGAANRFTPWGSINTHSMRLIPDNDRKVKHVAHRCNSSDLDFSSARSGGHNPPGVLRKRVNGVLRTPLNISNTTEKRHNCHQQDAEYALEKSSLSHRSSTYIENIQTREVVDHTIANLDQVRFGEDFLGKETSELSSPPPQPFPTIIMHSDPYQSPHPKLEHGGEQMCRTLKRTTFSPPMPPVPETDIEIHFKKRNDSSIRRVTTSAYRRQFIRGDDCHRMHSDGTYLAPARVYTTGLRRCQSPENVMYPALLSQAKR